LILSANNGVISGQAVWQNLLYWQTTCGFAGIGSGTDPVSGTASGDSIDITFNETGSWSYPVIMELAGTISGSVISGDGAGVSFAVARSSGTANFSNPENSGQWEQLNGYMAAEPVDTENGAQVVNHSILKIKGGQELGFEIDYNSLCLSNEIAGCGWSHNYEARLQSLSSTNILLIWNAKKSNLFTSQAKNTNAFRCSDLTCVYDSLTRNADGSCTLLEPSQRQLKFDSFGRLQTIVNPHGQAIQLAYGSSTPYPTQIVESVSGNALSLAYNASTNLITQVSDSLGRTATFSYDASSHLTLLTKTYQSVSQRYSFTYDSAGRMLTEINPEGIQIFTNTYDSNGRVSIQSDAVYPRFSTYFFYDESQTNTLTTTVIDRAAGVTQYTYSQN
jgi:YD repeat-containing protein